MSVFLNPFVPSTGHCFQTEALSGKTWTGEGNGNPLQCSCLENLRDGGACWAAGLWGRTESDTTEATAAAIAA